jgi:hypothetical protein
MQHRHVFRNIRMELEQHVKEDCKTLHHGHSYSSPDIYHGDKIDKDETGRECGTYVS